MSGLHEEHNRQESHTDVVFHQFSEVMCNHNYLHFYK